MEANETDVDGKLRIHRFHLYGEGKNPILRALRYVIGEAMLLHYVYGRNMMLRLSIRLHQYKIKDATD